MALLERGKGKRKSTIELVQFGEVLRMQEVEAGDGRLPGYRRYPTPDAARAALAAEVGKYLAEGMTPADDEAKAIAASIPARAAAGTLPLRTDLGVYNEATGFVITSRKMAGKTLDEGSAAWNKAVTNGDMIPVSLVQDDALVVRVVAGAPLTDEESAQWIARVDAQLNVPDGKLCITGGAPFANEDYDADDASWEAFVAEVAIPKGRYRATLYSVALGVNDDHGGERPDEPEYLDFLLHLEPVDAALKTGLTPVPKEGWFTGDENARTLPQRRGLEARDVVRKETSDGKWSFVYRVFEDMPKHDRMPVSGDAVSVPLEALASAGWIGWFMSRFVTLELRLTAAPGGALDLSGAWPDGMNVVVENGQGRILFDADLDMGTILGRLHELAPRLSALPHGTVLDLLTVAQQSLPGNPEGVGTLSLRGIIKDGNWRIAQAYPETSGATLNGAIALGWEVAGNIAITYRDGVEQAAIKDWMKSRFSGKPDVAQHGIAAFMHRFSGTWPCANLQPLEQEEEDDDEGDGLFPTKPIVGAEIFVAPSGRKYHQTMALLVSEKVAAEVQKREKALAAAKFRHVDDLVCSASENVAFRGYARPDGTEWAYFRVSAPATVALKIASTFDDNESFVTDAETSEAVADAVARHGDVVNEMDGMFGAPHKVEPKLAKFAEALETVFLSS